MSLESTLERIAAALESLVAVGRGKDVTVTTDTLTLPRVELGTPSVEAQKKPARGRPAKITTEEKAAATPAVVETKAAVVVTDDFLDTPAPTPPAKPLTIEDVRKALQVYAGAQGGGAEGTAKARALMTKASSNGAVRLSVAKDVPGGDQGVLLVADYAAVIAAAATPK